MEVAVAHEWQETLPSNHLLSTIKDLTAGAAGGVVQVLVGQPFDLLKVRLQSQGGGRIFETAGSIVAAEGVLAFYKGTLAPLLANGACVSIQFGAFHGVRRLLEQYNEQHRFPHATQLSAIQTYAAGGVAGVASSLLAGPVEHVRIQLQMQPHGVERTFSGPRHCLQVIVRQSGLAGLYRAQSLTAARDFHGYGMYFATYEVLVQRMAEWSQQKRSELPGWKIALCGALAGDALWLSVYPIDVIKTKLQSDTIGPGRTYSSPIAAFRYTWRQARIPGFFPGLGPALIRTMFTSAGTFLTVEQVKKVFDQTS